MGLRQTGATKQDFRMKDKNAISVRDLQQVTVSKEDAATLRSLHDGLDDYRESADKLGVVLEELVKMLDLDGSGIDAYLLHYVVDARQSLRSIIELLDRPSDMHI